MSNQRTELFLYTRAACSLCDQLGDSLDRRGMAYYSIDVDSDPELKHRYGARVPVLVAGDTEICAGRFDETTLDRLADIRPSHPCIKQL